MNARQWFLILLLVGLGAIAGGCYKPEPVNHEARVKAAVVVLGFTGGGQCSGTMVSEYRLLSAAHCFQGGRLLTVNEIPVKVVSYQHDGNDHALLTLDTAFKAYVVVNWEGLKQGDRLFMYGNPTFKDILRRGYVTGADSQHMLMDMPVSGGDSGAGLFNENGELVGVLSGYMLSGSGFQLSLAKPFTGSPETWPLVLED